MAFGKKTDPNGDYIKKYLPQLAKYPAKFIYEPWKAPLSVQQDCRCVIGKDYPARVVDHDIMVKENMGRMKAAYASQDGGDGDGGDDDDDEGKGNGKVKVESKASSSSSKNVKEEKKTSNSGAFADIFSPPSKKTKSTK